MNVAGFDVLLGPSSAAAPAEYAVVYVGSPDHQGWRSKDGVVAVLARRRVRALVAAALGLPARAVTVQARFGLDVGYPPEAQAEEAAARAWAEQENQRRLEV